MSTIYHYRHLYMDNKKPVNCPEESQLQHSIKKEKSGFFDKIKQIYSLFLFKLDHAKFKKQLDKSVWNTDYSTVSGKEDYASDSEDELEFPQTAVEDTSSLDQLPQEPGVLHNLS